MCIIVFMTFDLICIANLLESSEFSKKDWNNIAPLSVIQPLRDIACVVGQPARFECIVLAEPVPSISWTKDGSELHQTADFQMEYRNGVCRLVLPQARPCNYLCKNLCKLSMCPKPYHNQCTVWLGRGSLFQLKNIKLLAN